MDAIRAFTYQQLAYQKYVAAETALRNLILQSIEDKYINELEDEITGYTLVTPLKLMTHIWDNYGTIDDADHALNEENMRGQWSPPLFIIQPLCIWICIDSINNFICCICSNNLGRFS